MLTPQDVIDLCHFLSAEHPQDETWIRYRQAEVREGLEQDPPVLSQENARFIRAQLLATTAEMPWLLRLYARIRLWGLLQRLRPYERHPQ